MLSESASVGRNEQVAADLTLKNPVHVIGGFAGNTEFVVGVLIEYDELILLGCLADSGGQQKDVAHPTWLLKKLCITMCAGAWEQENEKLDFL
jgi:hypothetical protein